MPTCCNTLQYLEGGAYIAIIIAVIGVPQLLTYFLDRRDRRRDREEARQEAVWQRQEAERRHQETLIAMTNAIATAVAARNGNGRTSAEQAETLDELRQRVCELESEIARLRGDHADDGNGDGDALR